MTLIFTLSPLDPHPKCPRWAASKKIRFDDHCFAASFLTTMADPRTPDEERKHDQHAATRTGTSRIGAEPAERIANGIGGRGDGIRWPAHGARPARGGVQSAGAGAQYAQIGAGGRCV